MKDGILCVSADVSACLSPSGITVLLSLTVFMLLVAEIMPATSDSVPLIGKKTFIPPLRGDVFEKMCALFSDSQ